MNFLIELGCEDIWREIVSNLKQYFVEKSNKNV